MLVLVGFESNEVVRLVLFQPPLSLKPLRVSSSGHWTAQNSTSAQFCAAREHGKDTETDCGRGTQHLLDLAALNWSVLQSYTTGRQCCVYFAAASGIAATQLGVCVCVCSRSSVCCLRSVSVNLGNL